METNKNIFEQFQLKEKPQVPQGYFENLAAEMLSKVNEAPPTKMRVIYKRPLVWLSTVAAVALLFLGVRYFSQTQEVQLDDISDSEILAYVEEHLDDIDTELLIEAAEAEPTSPEKESSASEKTEVSSTKHIDSLSKEEILHYLNSQEVDLEDIEDIY